MKRKAILIESSNLDRQQDLPGARADVESFRRFLRSDAGGDWYDDEIVILHKPSYQDLQRELDRASSCDYSFITFSGHGEHVQGKTVDETRVCLNEETDLAAHRLNPGNDKCTILIDACRNVVPERVTEQYARSAMLKFALNSGKTGHRRIFDLAVAKCEIGPVFLYSCNLNESAGENDNGGFFSTFMVSEAENWFERCNDSGNVYLSMRSAFNRASPATTRRQPQQHPQYEEGRRQNSFPFAVYVP
ncbi:caspase family protein [Bremerella cremea]|uniref:caspase family protein n=1 Tax=Bremerella cremea TaxID=1031537 RepID=UPI0031E5BDFD